MRFESSITSVSWIPPGAFSGMMEIPVKLGVAHYDDPPPDVLDDLETLRQADGFRFANELRGWIEVDNGEIVKFGQEGGGRIGSTTLHLGRDIVVPAVAFPMCARNPSRKTAGFALRRQPGDAPAPPSPAGSPILRLSK